MFKVSYDRIFNKHYDEAGGKVSSFHLDPNKLNKNECHIFIPPQLHKELLILSSLEYFCFHPRTPLTDKYNFKVIEFDNLPLFWCSFPKEYRGAFERIAQTYNMSAASKSRAFAASKLTPIWMPKADHILVLNDEKVESPNITNLQNFNYAAHEAKMNYIRALGDAIQSVEMD